MLTILSLNLWGYKDWPKRERNIVQLLKTVSADVVALQEVQLDDEITKKSQSSILASSCGYKYELFVPACTKKGSGTSSRKVAHGLALLSKHEITTHSVHKLKKHIESHEQHVILIARLKVANNELDVCNVHFHNTDETSFLHLQETIEHLNDENIHPVMLGDFNIYKLADYKQLMPSYSLSTEFADYSSFVKDDGTLDYIAIPSDKFKFQSLHTSNSYISDHKAVWTDLELLDEDSND